MIISMDEESMQQEAEAEIGLRLRQNNGDCWCITWAVSSQHSARRICRRRTRC